MHGCWGSLYGGIFALTGRSSQCLRFDKVALALHKKIKKDQSRVTDVFKKFDTDGSGEISFNELNKALRRQVDFDAGHGERFDAATGTYTTGHMTVTQAKRSGGGERGLEGEA